MKFEVEKKTTFYSLDDLVEIERNGKPFYKAFKGEPFYFNLPKGKYELIDGEIVETTKNLSFHIDLPMKERNLKVPKLSFRFGNSPSKAHIFKKQGKITVDKFYENKPDYISNFMKWHEVGHYDYETEVYCDLFAANKMLSLGYNPSQIYSAMKEIFTENEDHQIERINTIKKSIQSNEISKSII